MDGDLEVVSELGAGSTFTFTAVVQASPDSEPDPSAGFAEGLSGRSVLVVDDSAASRAMLHELLASWGLVATAFASGPEALRWLSQGNGADVVLADLDMPEMDGLQLASALHQLPAAVRVPVILLAGLHRTSPQVDRSPVRAVVSKPVRSGALLGKLVDALAAPSAANRHAPTPPEPSEAREGRKLRVLLAEDNLVNQRVGQLMLAKLGHDVDLADTGLAAVQAIRAHRYDVVLMDLQMPQLDGFEATRRIRAEQADDHQPFIVALTANAYQDDWEACRAAGMDKFLAKPVRVCDLKNVLDQVPGASAEGSPDEESHEASADVVVHLEVRGGVQRRHDGEVLAPRDHRDGDEHPEDGEPAAADQRPARPERLAHPAQDR
jgi:CheY-like chemotaxis protein